MAEDRYVQKNIRFPQSLWDRLERLVRGNKSEFIRQAVEKELGPLETEERLKRLEAKVQQSD